MAVIACVESFPRQGTMDDKLVRTYKRTFVARCNTLNDDIATLRGAPGIDIADFYPSDVGALCNHIDPVQRAKPESMVWDITVSYSSETQDPSKECQNPLDCPAEISIDSQQFQRPVDFDISGNPLLASNDEPFDPAPQMDDSRIIIVIEKNVASLDYFDDVAPFKDAINTDSFMGYDPYTLKIYKIAGKDAYKNGVYYVKKRVEIHGIPDFQLPLQVNYTSGVKADTASPFDKFLINQGTYYIPEGGGKLPSIDPKTGLQYSKPQLLDLNGNALPQYQAGGLEPSVPTYNHYRTYKTVAFATLNLP
jgi:hypothetical protein